MEGLRQRRAHEVRTIEYPMSLINKELKADDYFNPSKVEKKTLVEHQRMTFALGSVSRALSFPPFVSRQKVGKRK